MENRDAPWNASHSGDEKAKLVSLSVRLPHPWSRDLRYVPSEECLYQFKVGVFCFSHSPFGLFETSVHGAWCMV